MVCDQIREGGEIPVQCDRKNELAEYIYFFIH